MKCRIALGVLSGCLCLQVCAAEAWPDYSTPEKTWATVCAAAKAKDLAAFRGCFYSSTDLARSFMSAYSDLTITTFKLADATMYLSGDGKAVAQSLQSAYAEMTAAAQNRTLVLQGDSAYWSRKQLSEKGVSEDRIYFKKVNGQWLIDTEATYVLDTEAGRKAAEALVEASKEQLPKLKKITDDLLANKITTLGQLRERLATSAPRK